MRITSNPPVPPSLLTWDPGRGPRARALGDAARRPGNTVDPGWDSISRAVYNSWIRNGETGARRLDLPIVDVTAGTTPIDLIRRPRPANRPGPGTPFQERFFRLASVRILLSDTAADITGLPDRSTARCAGRSGALTAGVTAGYAAATRRPRGATAAAGTVGCRRARRFMHRVHQDRAAAADGTPGTT